MLEQTRAGPVDFATEFADVWAFSLLSFIGSFIGSLFWATQLAALEVFFHIFLWSKHLVAPRWLIGTVVPPTTWMMLCSVTEEPIQLHPCPVTPFVRDTANVCASVIAGHGLPFIFLQFVDARHVLSPHLNKANLRLTAWHGTLHSTLFVDPKHVPVQCFRQVCLICTKRAILRFLFVGRSLCCDKAVVSVRTIVMISFTWRKLWNIIHNANRVEILDDSVVSTTHIHTVILYSSFFPAVLSSLRSLQWIRK